LQVGDEILVSGPIGRHGIAVLACREGLDFDPPPTSDSGPLVAAFEALRAADIPIRAMRDATRGGLSAVLHEWAESSGWTLAVNEQYIPISADVRGACEVLGIDPLHVANEGTMVVAVPAGSADAAIHAWRSTRTQPEAAHIGSVRDRLVVPVVIRRALGRELALDEPSGAQLPRIC
jgi:hydrogenase expression/formation protein HypE